MKKIMVNSGINLNNQLIIFCLLILILSNTHCKKNNSESQKYDNCSYTMRIDFITIDSNWLFKNMDSLSIGLSRVFPVYKSDYFKEQLIKAYQDKNRYYLLKRNFSSEKLEELKSLPVFENHKLKYGFIVLKK